MSGLVQGMSVSASVFTLVAIAVERYVGVGNMGLESPLIMFGCPVVFHHGKPPRGIMSMTHLSRRTTKLSTGHHSKVSFPTLGCKQQC